MFSVIFTNFHIVLNVDSDVFTVLFHNLCNELKKNSNRACMPRGNTDSTLNQAYADDPKAGTKNLSEDQIKSFIAGLVSSKKSETQLQSDIRKLSMMVMLQLLQRKRMSSRILVKTVVHQKLIQILVELEQLQLKVRQYERKFANLSVNLPGRELLQQPRWLLHCTRNQR